MRRHIRGFTLIEMVISLVILGIVGAIVAAGIQGGVFAYQQSATSLENISKIRVTSERLLREFREIRRDPLNTLRYDITEPFAAGNILFVKSDGTTVTVTASLPLLTIAYDTPAGTHTLSDQLTGFTLQYFQADGTTSSVSATDVAFIELELTLDDGHGNALSQRSRIGLRNQP